MRICSTIIALVAFVATSACARDGVTAPNPPQPAAPAVLLKDLVTPSLPSPYFHFEYNTTGRVSTASYASGFWNYSIAYDGGRISEMRNDILVNHDRLEYVYDDSSRVGTIKYADASGVVYTVVFFTYDGPKLIGVERDRKVDAGFIVDKTMSLTYSTDGNLFELTERYPAIEGQAASTTVDRFEQYDDKINVDDFSLLHTEYLDHVFLLPGVRLQHGNPGRVTRTGDGVNYAVAYSYVYDSRGRPLTKSGDGTISNGDGAGRRFQVRSEFSYY